MNGTNKKQGECETCPKNDVEVTLRYGNTWMCDECWQAEPAAQVSVTTRGPNPYLRETVKQDASIQIKQELFNAGTRAIVEIHEQIKQDESIPSENKMGAERDVVFNRIHSFQKAIFDKRSELVALENELRAMQTHLQTITSTLSKEEQAKYRVQDMNYVPTPPKSLKQPVKTGTKKATKAEINAAAQKYGILPLIVTMLVTSRNMSAEDAARSAKEAETKVTNQ